MQEEAGLGHTASFSPTMHKIQMQDIFFLWKGVATVASVETVLSKEVGKQYFRVTDK
jgi:hypothetical protein